MYIHFWWKISIHFLDSKSNNETNIEMMLWQHCMPQSLHDYVKKPDNFEKLCSGTKSFKEANLVIKGFVSIQNIMMMYMLILKILQWLINIFIQCFSQSFMLIMINLVLKIRFNLRYIIKTGKKNLPVVVIPYVVIDPTKMGKSPINFERKVEAFEQRPIKVDEIVPFFLSVTV